MQLVVDSTGLEKYAKQLNEINRSAYPVAVRQTLNSAAFDVKQRTMLKTAKDTFEERSPNFFKANSTVERANGFTIAGMKSTIGFQEKSLKGDSNYSVKDLQEQEEGGSIGGKAFIPTIYARKGNNRKGAIRANARLEKIQKSKIIDSKKVRALSKKQRFFLAALQAGRGGYVIHAGVLWRVTGDLTKLRSSHSSIHNTADGKRTAHFDFRGQIDRKPLYSVRKGRSIKVKATHFMKEASLDSAKLLNDHFIKHAEAQILKNAK